MGSIEKSRWVSCRLNSALKVGVQKAVLFNGTRNRIL